MPNLREAGVPVKILRRFGRFLDPLERAAKRVREGGARQVAPSLEGIRPDHLARYRFAASYVRPGFRVLDAACGVGYGASILATSAEGVQVTAVDASELAVDYGRMHYAPPGVQYLCSDVLELGLEPDSFDLVVTFETVEHVDDDLRLLGRFSEWLEPEGLLILSTPNEDVMPFDAARFPHHVRHYRPDTLRELTHRSGFEIIRAGAQVSKKAPEIREGWHGSFNVVVCRRSSVWR